MSGEPESIVVGARTHGRYLVRALDREPAGILVGFRERGTMASRLLRGLY